MRSIGEQVITEHLRDGASLNANKLISFLNKVKITKIKPHHVDRISFGDRMSERQMTRAWMKRPIRVFILLALITTVYHVVDKWKRFKRLFNSDHYG